MDVNANAEMDMMLEENAQGEAPPEVNPPQHATPNGLDMSGLVQGIPTLGKLFLQPIKFTPGIQPRTAETFSVQHKICKYLNLFDLKSLLKTNTFCHIMVLQSPSFCNNNICKISDVWHKTILRSRTMDTGVPWRYFELDHFAFHRKLPHFKDYWKKSSKQMIDLKITNSSLECDGASFIINECTKLNTLTLEKCRLKHWSPTRTFVHEEGPLVSADNLQIPDEARTLEMRQALKNLVINDLKVDFPCQFKYLERRTGFLESLSISNCMKEFADIHLENPQVEIYRTGLIDLMRANQGTLRKLTIDGNSFQTHLIRQITEQFPNQLHLTHLALSVPEDFTNSNAFITMLSANLTELSLRFDKKSFTPIMLERLVTPVLNSLRKLDVKVIGGRENGGILNPSPPVQVVQIGTILERFEQLQCFNISDEQSLLYKRRDILHSQGRKTRKGGYRPSNDQVTWAQESLKSPISSESLTSLPASVTELCVNKVLMRERFFSDLRTSLGVLRGHQNFTKLEIRGPLFFPIRKGFEIITRNMRSLRTLIMVDCGLTDAFITGLSCSACKEIRKCGVIDLSLWEDNNESFQAILQSARKFDFNDEMEVNDENEEDGEDVAEDVAEEDDIDEDLAINDDIDDENVDIGDEIEDIEALILEAIQAGMNAVVEPGIQHPNDIAGAGGDAQLEMDVDQYPELQRTFIHSLHDLEHLDLSLNIDVTDVSIFDSIRNPSLKVLKLIGCSKVTDTGLRSIGKFNPNLEELHVKDCRRLSRFGFEGLIQSCPKLRDIQTTWAVAEYKFDSKRKAIPIYYDVVKYPHSNDI